MEEIFLSKIENCCTNFSSIFLNSCCDYCKQPQCDKKNRLSWRCFFIWIWIYYKTTCGMQKQTSILSMEKDFSEYIYCCFLKILLCSFYVKGKNNINVKMIYYFCNFIAKLWIFKTCHDFSFEISLA